MDIKVYTNWYIYDIDATGKVLPDESPAYNKQRIQASIFQRSDIDIFRIPIISMYPRPIMSYRYQRTLLMVENPISHVLSILVQKVIQNGKIYIDYMVFGFCIYRDAGNPVMCMSLTSVIHLLHLYDHLPNPIH